MPIKLPDQTDLSFGACADGQTVKRVGLELVGYTPAGGGQAFPVGSVFIAVVSTNPATLLGYGTWAALGAGRVLVGYDAADADFNAAKKTGGAKTVAASVGNHAAGVTGAASAGAQKIGTTTSTVTLAAHTHATPALTHTVTPTSVVQPYITVFMWERTV